MEEEDRISQLPDQILQQILSLIDTNQALQTTILSTRWKTLPLTLPDLRFHLRTPLNNFNSAQALSHRFSHLLSRRDAAATVRSFHLSLETDAHLPIYADESFIHKCTLYAVSRGVRSLRLHARCRPYPTLPAAFFASRTLRELELRQLGCVVCAPSHLSLPHLKTLFLESSWFGQYDSPEPFSSLPELEKLTLRRCPAYGLVVKAPKLRFLEIVEDNVCSDDGIEEISAPLLTSFRYEGRFPFKCCRVNLPMLEEVYVNIRNNRHPYNIYIYFNPTRTPMKCVRMFQLLGDSKIVALTLDTLKVLEIDQGLIEITPCRYPYMKCLKLMKERREIPTVLREVRNYLTEEALHFDSFVVELPLVEKNSKDFFEDESEEQQLELLFGVEDEI